ncbi:MAG: hypothetical protein K1X79_11730 [Oligoflexia bacterium]|nr:hypothetical protein [Oligoflexia bacterium]
MNSATMERQRSAGPDQRQGRQEEPSLTQILDASVKNFPDPGIASMLRQSLATLPEDRESKQVAIQIFATVGEVCKSSVDTARNMLNRTEHISDKAQALAFYQGVATVYRSVADATAKKDEFIHGSNFPSVVEVDRYLQDVVMKTFGQAVRAEQALKNFPLSLAQAEAGQPGSAWTPSDTTALVKFIEGVSLDIDAARTKGRDDLRVYRAERAALEAGPAAGLMQTLMTGVASGPAVVGTFDIRQPNGQLTQMEISRDNDGQAFATFRVDAARAGDPPLQIKVALDKESLIADGSLTHDPDKQAEQARVRGVEGRVLKRLDELMKAWEAVANSPTATAGLVQNSAWGLLGSEIGKALVNSGCKITELSNGALEGSRGNPLYIGGLDLSGVQFKDFSIRHVVAPSLDLSGSTWTGKYKVEHNKLLNVVLDNADFQGDRHCKFSNNDCHGPNSSLRNVNFNGVKARSNNLLGADLKGLRAESITDKAGLASRINFRAQFGGTYFSGSKVDEGAKAIFINIKNSRGLPPDKHIALTAHPEVGAIMDIIEKSPFIKNSTNPTDVPATQKNHAGKEIEVTSRDGKSKAKLFVEDRLAYGYLDGDKEATGTLDLLKRVMDLAQKNRRVEQAKATGPGSSASESYMVR